MISKSIQTEIDACYLYLRLAEHEADPVIADIFHKMSEIEIYKSPDNKIELQVNLKNETVWLSQKQIATGFGAPGK